MNYIKRIAVILLIAIISICAVFYSYYGIKNGAVVFADDNSNLLTNDELDIAISSWLQSHGGNLFSPSNYLARKTYEAGLIHNFVYGIDDGYDGVRQHIKGGIGGNNELRFDFDGLILQRLNTWLNEKLQNGEFGQGVQLQENGMFNDDVDNELYSGKLFTDPNGNKNLVWVFDGGPYGSHEGFRYSSELQKGTFINDKFGTNIENGYVFRNIYYYDYYHNGHNYASFTYSTISRNRDINVSANGTYEIEILPNNGSLVTGIASGGNPNRSSAYCSTVYYNNALRISGGLGYGFSRTYNKYYLIYISHDNKYPNIWYMDTAKYFEYEDSSVINDVNVDVNFYTNNNNLNITNYPDIDADGHLYITPKVKINGEYKPYIVNEGDTINNVINNYYTDSNTKDKTISEPSDNPNGGGGGNNPSGGTPPNWTNPYPNLSPDGNGGFNFNFTLPDLNIDWNINGLTEKFPFSIPFDFIAFCRVLNAEPQTPEWSGTLVLPMVNYPFTFSLQQFDNVASLLRNMEFIGFCIALILATRALIKG